MSYLGFDYNQLSSSEQDRIVTAIIRAMKKFGDFDYMLEDDIESYSQTELFDTVHYYLEDNYCDIEFDLDKCIEHGCLTIE